MNELVQYLREEAARNAQLQGDKEHQTNRRRKTFRYRNHMLTKCADELEALGNLQCRLYNSGYHAGHEDTVESCYTDIYPVDMDTYHANIVKEIVNE